MCEYIEDEYLLLSGIQHFAFCPRQWALIHIENLWQENYLTASGRIMHEKAHDGESFEKRGKTIIFRSLKISSKKLGISGECDIVEFHEKANGIHLRRYKGLWIPFPIEYKRGKSKLEDCDRLQLCAQAVCLEEMLGCEIKEGALFYGESKRREPIEFTIELRKKLEFIIKDMHNLYSRNYTPKVKTGKYCLSCSLKNQCIPNLCKKDEKNVRKYMESSLL